MGLDCVDSPLGEEPGSRLLDVDRRRRGDERPLAAVSRVITGVQFVLEVDVADWDTALPAVLAKRIVDIVVVDVAAARYEKPKSSGV